MDHVNDLSSVSKDVVTNVLEDAITFLVDDTGVEFEITEAISEVHQSSKACVNQFSLIKFSEEDACPVQAETSVSFPLTFQLSANLDVNQQDIVDCNINTNELIVSSSTNEATKQSQPSFNILTPVQIPEGPTLFVLESETAGGPSQVLAMSTKELPLRGASIGAKCNNVIKKTPGKRKSESQNNQETITRKHSKLESATHSTYLFNTNSVITVEDGLTVQQFFCCDYCSTSEQSTHFRSYKELTTHYLSIHRLRLLKQASAACREENCSFKASRVDDLRQHLRTAHSFTMEVKNLQFSSSEEFEQWKLEEEARSGSKFIRSSGEHSVPPRNGNLAYNYLTCHRSGIHRGKTKGDVKKKKAIPSLKINGVCTATMIVTHDRQAGKVTCEYHSSHYGHDFSNPGRQCLSKQEKEWIFELILRGWNSDEIVKTLRSGTIPGTSDRMRRAVRQDIFNICRSKRVRSFERRDEDDSLSVHKWAEELHAKGSVLLWTCDPQLFLLVVMNDHQAELARRYGIIIYIADLPLALTNHYRLITLTVPADKESYLIAYALTDKPGADIIKVIVASIKAKIDSFEPEFVLCQNPNVLNNAWRLSKAPLFLFPPWKIEKEWNDGLFKYVEDVGKRDALKKCMETLLSEKDPSKFTSFLHLFTTMLAADESLRFFSRCFAAAYSEQAPHWPCFHPLPDCTSLQNLNSEIELIARRARAIKRLDKCIYSLEYVSANQPFHSFTQFQTRIRALENEITSLRDTTLKKLDVLGKTIQSCTNLAVLKTLNRILDQALV